MTRGGWDGHGTPSSSLWPPSAAACTLWEAIAASVGLVDSPWLRNERARGVAREALERGRPPTRLDSRAARCEYYSSLIKHYKLVITSLRFHHRWPLRLCPLARCPAPAMPPKRVTGLQRQVLHLYKRALQMVATKPIASPLSARRSFLRHSVISHKNLD